ALTQPTVRPRSTCPLPQAGEGGYGHAARAAHPKLALMRLRGDDENAARRMLGDQMMSDPLIIAGREFHSRLFLGTAGYPNRTVMLDAIAASGTQMVTASIRRISLAGDDESLVELIGDRAHFLPHHACRQPAIAA